MIEIYDYGNLCTFQVGIQLLFDEYITHDLLKGNTVIKEYI